MASAAEDLKTKLADEFTKKELAPLEDSKTRMVWKGPLRRAFSEGFDAGKVQVRLETIEEIANKFDQWGAPAWAKQIRSYWLDEMKRNSFSVADALDKKMQREAQKYADEGKVASWGPAHLEGGKSLAIQFLKFYEFTEKQINSTECIDDYCTEKQPCNRCEAEKLITGFRNWAEK